MSKSRSTTSRTVRRPDSAAALIPDHSTLDRVRRASRACQACDLWKTGTQTVFGEGPSNASLMLIGEQRRIHKKPNSAEIGACRPWLDTEIALVKPRVIVCLGSTAAQALLGKGFKVTAHRGERIESPLAPVVMATVHPSSLLRAPDGETRRHETELFVEDLRKVARALK